MKISNKIYTSMFKWNQYRLLDKNHLMLIWMFWFFCTATLEFDLNPPLHCTGVSNPHSIEINRSTTASLRWFEATYKSSRFYLCGGYIFKFCIITLGRKPYQKYKIPSFIVGLMMFGITRVVLYKLYLFYFARVVPILIQLNWIF